MFVVLSRNVTSSYFPPLLINMLLCQCVVLLSRVTECLHSGSQDHLPPVPLPPVVKYYTSDEASSVTDKTQNIG